MDGAGKRLTWDHRYELGHQRIDAEHRIFLGLLSDFQETITPLSDPLFSVAVCSLAPFFNGTDPAALKVIADIAIAIV